MLERQIHDLEFEKNNIAYQTYQDNCVQSEPDAYDRFLLENQKKQYEEEISKQKRESDLVIFALLSFVEELKQSLKKAHNGAWSLSLYPTKKIVIEKLSEEFRQILHENDTKTLEQALLAYGGLKKK